MVDTSELWTFLRDLLMAFVTYMAMNVTMWWKKKDEKHIVETTEEHEFTDTKYLCILLVDISNYTRVTSSIHQQDKWLKYHSIFHNTMEAIARNFGAKVPYRGIDKVISFFPITSQPSSDKTPFKDALKCGLAMQAAHDDMNQKYYEEGLPPINYRISADCGKYNQVEAVCYNIYTKASPNGMVIGENLYDMINDSFEYDYHFTKIHEYPADKDAKNKNSYPIYFNPYSVYLITRRMIIVGAL
jgi:two-component system, OmpR family, response regulator ChvI